MKLKDWDVIEPFRYYLQPLKDHYTIMREEALWLHKQGILHCRFPLTVNYCLEKKVIDMVARDVIVQRLIETPVK